MRGKGWSLRLHACGPKVLLLLDEIEDEFEKRVGGSADGRVGVGQAKRARA